MEAQPPQFVGPPCGQYGAHTFYRGFRYTKQGKSREISLGEFFFVRISAEEDPCIGELQLLCSNRNNDLQLSALRLYFLPEQTPDGRLSHHGEDEVLVASDRVVLKLDDLVSWITDEVEWNHGIIAPYVEKPISTAVKKEEVEEPQNDSNNNDTSSVPPTNLDKENSEVVDEDQKKDVEVKQENIKEIKQDPEDDKGTKVLILSYQSYFRYRTILKRIDGGDSFEWLQNDIVLALGGILPSNPRTRVLFCRDNFEHDELAHHELNCEYLAPTLKGKRKKRKTKTARSTSPESNTSDECKTIEIKNNQKTNGLKQPPIKNEQEFLQRLFKFMKKRNTPIHRVPHLGFKQIDLYVFYSFAQKLGGYDKITTKKLWKHVYDELGGNPGSTSAATCTRRHYERLLLPFERFMDGILYKPTSRGKKSQKKKQQQLEDGEELKDDSPNGSIVKSESNNISTEIEDAYAFTDSNHENSNSKDSNSNEFNSACDEQPLTNEPPFSDEDSKTVWSIQKPPDNKDEASQDKDDSKSIKPLIIQKGQSETFAEKERKWDEIRRKNAAARKWVRQSRSSRGCKTPIPEIPPYKQDKQNGGTEIGENLSPEAIKVNSETIDLTTDQNAVPCVSPHDKLVVESKIGLSVQPGTINNMNKFLPPGINPEALNGKTKVENHSQKKRHILAKETPSHLSSDKKTTATAKTENDKHTKSWCGYPTSGDSYQGSLHSRMDIYPPGLMKGHLPLAYNGGTRSEPDVNRDYPLQTGRHSVGSVSASSVISIEASTGDEKPLVPQRRPSVIQHTEYAATSPSPSLSPKQVGSDCRNVSPKEGTQSIPFSSPKMNLLPNQLSYTLNGKVTEWLTKGVHEVVACKTPSVAVEKSVELHDKVMMPSSCKMPGAVGTGKVPVNNVKSKQSNASNSHKSPRSKYSSSHRHRNSDGAVNGTYNTMSRNDVRINVAHQKMLHPVPLPYSAMTNPVSAPKYQHNVNQKTKTEFYPNGPYYNQPKRYKANNMVPIMMTPISPRPTLSPFVRQQTYCTPPLSDIPKTTASTHNDYDSVVLDLSVKKKPAHSAAPRTIASVSVSPVPEEGVCLDLSIKKKTNNSVATDNGIENITPPLPLSPNSSSQSVSSFMHSSLKPLPTLIALQDLASEEAAHRGYASSNSHIPPMTSAVTVPVSAPPLVMPPAMFPGSAHGKLPPALVNTLPSVTYSKDMAKNLYIPSNTRHSQFPPYVIPPFFASTWTSVNTSATNAKQTNNSQTSLTYKGMVNHSVFPKDYPYNVKSQYHPVLCKDSGHYPSNDNK
ncbi:AT-rich interactive domain-containing protein 5B [Nephila pilipes]|uniref:AT-rich interactive domain-containing protein 5B n=1 Tax=Nephila pilipes TaxID=299642 RepID=A0A8X6TCB8_NEPPI|nr:AT-rich interactive domain-containing protein 5B [Nephila pilipes]